jgi:hypothetical protein
MLGNSSNKQRSVARTWFSDSSVFVRLGFKIKTKTPNNSRPVLFNSDTPAEILNAQSLTRYTWEANGPFSERAKPSRDQSVCVLFLLSDVPTEKSRSRSGISESPLECGMCFQMPLGSSASLYKDILWHPEQGRQLEVPFIRKTCWAGLGWERTIIDSDVQ